MYKSATFEGRIFYRSPPPHDSSHHVLVPLASALPATPTHTAETTARRAAGPRGAASATYPCSWSASAAGEELHGYRSARSRHSLLLHSRLHPHTNPFMRRGLTPARGSWSIPHAFPQILTLPAHEATAGACGPLRAPAPSPRVGPPTARRTDPPPYPRTPLEVRVTPALLSTAPPRLTNATSLRGQSEGASARRALTGLGPPPSLRISPGAACRSLPVVSRRGTAVSRPGAPCTAGAA